jgi:tetratricopeptide (TPR) repeat protein
MTRIHSWLLKANTPALLGGAVVAMIVGVWALYMHFSKPPEIKPANNCAHMSDSVTAGRDMVIQNIQTTPEQFDALLQKRLKEVKAQLPQANPQQRAQLEKGLAAIKDKYDNLQKAFEEQKARLAKAYQALDSFKHEVPAEQVKQAQQALARGETKPAENLYQQVLAKSTAGAEKHTKVAAAAAYQLGVLAESRINYGQAERYYHQAIQLQPDNSEYLNAAGYLSLTLGNYQETEKVLKRALKLREKSLKADAPALAASLNNLAVLYKIQGKAAEAEPLYQRALAINEKALGPEHPDVAVSLYNLAELYRAQGKYKEAEPLYKRALAIWEKASEPGNPNVALCLENYAALLRKTGRGAEAEPLEARAQANREMPQQCNPEDQQAKCIDTRK